MLYLRILLSSIYQNAAKLEGGLDKKRHRSRVRLWDKLPCHLGHMTQLSPRVTAGCRYRLSKDPVMECMLSITSNLNSVASEVLVLRQAATLPPGNEREGFHWDVWQPPCQGTSRQRKDVL